MSSPGKPGRAIPARNRSRYGCKRKKRSTPLIGFYQLSSILVTITASGSPEENCERTIAALEDWQKRKSTHRPA
jgi:hypothetical protein